MKAEFDWNDGKYVPDDKVCYCLCEMEGMPFTKYALCKWDGELWFIWLYFKQDLQGWFGLKEAWKIKRWAIIEEDEEC